MRRMLSKYAHSSLICREGTACSLRCNGLTDSTSVWWRTQLRQLNCAQASDVRQLEMYWCAETDATSVPTTRPRACAAKIHWISLKQRFPLSSLLWHSTFTTRRRLTALTLKSGVRKRQLRPCMSKLYTYMWEWKVHRILPTCTVVP